MPLVCLCMHDNLKRYDNSYFSRNETLNKKSQKHEDMLQCKKRLEMH